MIYKKNNQVLIAFRDKTALKKSLQPIKTDNSKHLHTSLNGNLRKKHHKKPNFDQKWPKMDDF